MNRYIDFYTDGAYSSKSEIAGWACICLENDVIIDEHTGFEPFSTNNRGELFGMLCALTLISQIETANTYCTIYCDSAYIVNCLNDGWYRNWLKNGWRTADKKDVKNQDIWGQVIALYIKLKEKFHITVEKVEAHKDNKWNKYADLLSKKARTQIEGV